MRIAVISDTHYIPGMTKLPVDFWSMLQGVDGILHCGDIGDRTFYEDLALLAPVTAVLGNNDGAVFGTMLPERRIVTVGAVRIGMFHGHRGAVPFGFRSEEVDLLLCGHTHVPLEQVMDGIRVLNPGSVTRPRGGSLPSMGILEICGREVRWQPVALGGC